jgi:hypothetical protein
MARLGDHQGKHRSRPSSLEDLDLTGKPFFGLDVCLVGALGKTP